jgi:hypothetical protein
MRYLKHMRKTLLHRIIVPALLIGVLVGWSAQAMSFAFTGSCMGAMASMDMSPTTPPDPADDADDAGAMPCKGIAVQCMNSLGCIVFVGLPQAIFAVDRVDRFDDPNGARIRDLVGLAHEPELFPPIDAA